MQEKLHGKQSIDAQAFVRHEKVQHYLKNFKNFFEKVLTLFCKDVIISKSPDGDGNE